MAWTFVDFLITKFGKKVFLEKYSVWKYKDLIALESEWVAYLKERTSEERLKEMLLPSPANLHLLFKRC